MSNVVISVEGLGKRYRIAHQAEQTTGAKDSTFL